MKSLKKEQLHRKDNAKPTHMREKNHSNKLNEFNGKKTT